MIALFLVIVMLGIQILIGELYLDYLKDRKGRKV